MHWFYLTVIFTILALPGLVKLIRGTKTQRHVETLDMTSSDRSRDYAELRSNVRMADRPWPVLVTFVAAPLAVLCLLLSSFYLQDAGTAKLVRNFGGSLAYPDTTAGIGFKFPTQDTVTYNVRNQKIEMFGGTESQNPETGKHGAAITAPLDGSANAFVSITIAYSINGEVVERIYGDYGSQENLEDTVIKPNLRDIVRVETSKFPPFLIKQERAELSDNIRKALQDKWAHLDDGTGEKPLSRGELPDLVVEEVNLGDIRLDPDTEKVISEINVARGLQEQASINRDTAEISADKKRIDAKAQADSDQIIRCGATTSTIQVEINGTKQDQIKVTPIANAACENRLNAQVLTAKWLETLATLGDKGNVTLVVPNTPDGGLSANPRIDIPLPTTQR